MPIGLRLDPVTGDLAHPVALETDRATLVATRLRARLEAIRAPSRSVEPGAGDWFLDRAFGADWLAVLGEKPDRAAARRVVVEALLLDEDVAEASADVSIDRTSRRASISARAVLTDGSSIVVAADLAI